MRHDDHATATANRAVLPAVIRPRPLLLSELEELVAGRDPRAKRLAADPALVEHVATFVHARDGAARSRFPSRNALAAHLRALLLG